ncbi:MAG: hypothetical protein GX194_14030 [Clostridium sp.]|nr:hypothetical protein [Clostridium sp.]
MINLEVLRLELNYLEQVAKDILGDKASGKISEAITALIICFLYPNTYDSLSLSYIQIIEQYLNQIKKEIESDKYQLLMNNISTIRVFMEKVKSEIPRFL